MWSRKFDACRFCGATDYAHHARGLCRRCYSEWRFSYGKDYRYHRRCAKVYSEVRRKGERYRKRVRDDRDGRRICLVEFSEEGMRNEVVSRKICKKCGREGKRVYFRCKNGLIRPSDVWLLCFACWREVTNSQMKLRKMCRACGESVSRSRGLCSRCYQRWLRVSHKVCATQLL